VSNSRRSSNSRRFSARRFSARPLAAPVSCAAEAAAVGRPVFRRWKWEQEVFVVLLLDSQYCLIAKPEVIAVGTLCHVEVHPRDVFRRAVRSNAKAVIVMHCHPSGELKPSHDDLAVTGRLREAGKLLGIELLDHVVVTRDAEVSLLDKL